MKEARCGFNPCLFNEYVYLCGFGSKQMEAFSPQTNDFRPLPLSQLPENSLKILYVDNNLLVVHSDNFISKFAAGQKGQLAHQSQFKTHNTVKKWTNSQPVLDPARGLFYLIQGHVCVCFDMETGGNGAF